MARRLGLILAGLVGLIARRFLRMPHLVGLTVALCARLGRAGRRFARALARSGKIRLARASRAGMPAGDGARTPSVRLPSGRGWLVRELGWEAAGYGCQLEAFLAEPAMQQALTALPAVGRILRPLCRMLAVVAPGVAPPTVAAAVDVAPVVKARRAKGLPAAVKVSVWPRKGLPQLPKGAWFAPPVKNSG